MKTVLAFLILSTAIPLCAFESYPGIPQAELLPEIEAFCKQDNYPKNHRQMLEYCQQKNKQNPDFTNSEIALCLYADVRNSNERRKQILINRTRGQVDGYSMRDSLIPYLIEDRMDALRTLARDANCQ